jgi:iron complex transport system substrate-binding protein
LISRAGRFALRLFLLLAVASAAEASIELKQEDGATLRLESPAARLVTLAPHLTELVFAAGAGDKIAATVEYSEYPEAARGIPRVGDAFRLDTERIFSLDADLVIAWHSGNPATAIQQLTDLGVPVWSVEIRRPAEIADMLEAIGAAAGTVETARSVAHSLRERLRALAAEYRGEATLDYFYQVDSRPLFTINGAHLISRGLELCGGRNIFESEPGLAFQVSYESVIVANPDAVFAPRAGPAEDPLAAWRQWPGMDAVQRDSLYLLPADSISRATPRFLDSLELACKLLHRLRQSVN